MKLRIYIFLSVFVSCFAALAGEPAVYDSLDDAIEAEIEGIDFTDLSGLYDYAICGQHEISAGHLSSFVKRHNPDFDENIAICYIEIGARYGIRGDIAFCQAILETGWFKFTGGTAVKSDQYNYCGLGVVKKGVAGEGFKTVAEGVTAHIQHLYAYATRDALPKGETLVDPRFKAVSRGVAVGWSDLNNRWAMNDVYGMKILKIFERLQEYAAH